MAQMNFRCLGKWPSESSNQIGAENPKTMNLSGDSEALLLFTVMPSKADAALPGLKARLLKELERLNHDAEQEADARWKDLLSYLRRDGSLEIESLTRSIEKSMLGIFKGQQLDPAEKAVLVCKIKLQLALTQLYFESYGVVNGTLASDFKPYFEAAARCLKQLGEDTSPDFLTAGEMDIIMGYVNSNLKFPVYNLEPRALFQAASPERRRRAAARRYEPVSSSMMGPDVAMISTPVTRQGLNELQGS